MKSLLWKIWFILFMLLCMLGFFLLIIGKLILPKKSYRKIVSWAVKYWGRRLVNMTGSEVEIIGKENLPDDKRICFVSNHQGMFDIPLVLGFVGRSCGFVAKKELLKVPVLAWWMLEIPCVFIDRSSARKARESIIKSAEVIKNGHAMVIFPEGTRSKGAPMGEFKRGSFKLPTMAEATIVPLAINNTWKILEETGKIKAQKLTLEIMQPIRPEDPIYQDQQALCAHLEEQIRARVEA
jgi:1-acyl-sn-glycerol-3-phosphate acyltransferase